MTKTTRKKPGESHDDNHTTHTITIPAWLYTALLIGVSFLAGFVVATIIFTNWNLNEQTRQFVEEVAALFEANEGSAAAQPQTEVQPAAVVVPEIKDYDWHRTEEGDPAIGAEDAPVTIVEYSDFRCGYCRRFFEQTLPPLIDQYGDQVRFVYRDAPVLGSTLPAIAAECADEQDRFWDYHHYIFSNQGKMDQNGLLELADHMGLDMDAFSTCLSEQATAAEVQEDFDYARSIGVSGTPTFTINGEILVGAQPLQAFASAIDTALEAEEAGGDS